MRAKEKSRESRVCAGEKGVPLADLPQREARGVERVQEVDVLPEARGEAPPGRHLDREDAGHEAVQAAVLYVFPFENTCFSEKMHFSVGKYISTNREDSTTFP